MSIRTTPPRLDPDTAARRTADLLPSAGFVLFWSSGFIGAEMASRVARPDTFLAWRLAVATAVIWWLVLVIRPRLTRRGLLVSAGIGLLTQAIYLGGVFVGASLGVPAGSSALVTSLQPMLVAALLTLLRGGHVGPRQWGGVVIGFAGVTVVVSGDLSAAVDPWGLTLVFVAMLALSAGTLVQSTRGHGIGLLESLAGQTLSAAAAFWVWVLLTGRTAPPDDAGGFWFAVAWVVVLSTLGGYGCYLIVVRTRGSLTASTLLYLTPATTALWAWMWFGERPAWTTAVGLVVCLIGVALTESATRHRRVAHAPGES